MLIKMIKVLFKKSKYYGLLLTGLLFSCQSEIYFEDAYCIKNVNVIDPLEGLQKNINIVIKGNLIHRIDRKEKLNLSLKNKIIDGSNKLSGDKAEIDFNTGVSRMLSTKTGGRVSGRFTGTKQ